MKRLLLFSIMVLSSLTMIGQTRGFLSTGQNVNVRTGPGKQYALARDFMGGEKCQLTKGQLVIDKGESKNGFRHVYISNSYWEYHCEGWVSEQYLKPVRLCRNCKGEGYTDIEGFEVGNQCKRCRGKGYMK